MMKPEQELLPGLFRTEYGNLVSVLCYKFGIENIAVAEDIVSDTFLTAMETWSLKEIPGNPKAWLYTVAKNKTQNYLKRHSLFNKKIAAELKHNSVTTQEIEIDLSPKNINDSQLAMMFTVCDPCIPADAQTSLALHLLCGFGVQEIADAYLTSKEVVYKRISRAKEKLREHNIRIQHPGLTAISDRLEQVLTTLYLLFSEGHYSKSHDLIVRRDLCNEAMRLTLLLIENDVTNKPAVNALYALMCFHASRLDARITGTGEAVLYEDQDETLWDRSLVEKGIEHLNLASRGSYISRYHLEAGIAYWHTHKEDTPAKWEEILQLYNQLLQIEYSPIAALNRTFALAKARGKAAGIKEAEKLQLNSNPFYFSLLGNLYTDIDNATALQHYTTALEFANTAADKQTIRIHMEKIIHEIKTSGK
jgi:RNA polymerase sigma-70 factor (ECF subfamily)